MGRAEQETGSPHRQTIDDTCPTDEEHLLEDFLDLVPSAPRVKLNSDVLDTGRHHVTQHCPLMMTTWKHAREVLSFGIEAPPQADAPLE